nr:hypothetical protein [Rhizobium mesoamericanum]
MRKVAKAVTDVVRRETTALATGAADHPHTATSVVLSIGALAFAIGYVVGKSSAERSYSYWR